MGNGPSAAPASQSPQNERPAKRFCSLVCSKNAIKGENYHKAFWANAYLQFGQEISIVFGAQWSWPLHYEYCCRIDSTKRVSVKCHRQNVRQILVNHGVSEWVEMDGIRFRWCHQQAFSLSIVNICLGQKLHKRQNF